MHINYFQRTSDLGPGKAIAKRDHAICVSMSDYSSSEPTKNRTKGLNHTKSGQEKRYCNHKVYRSALTGGILA
jgi:hypothetical protein